MTKEWKNTNENKNVSPLNKLYLPWTTSDCSTSTTHFIAHPMACLAGMISIFSSAQHPELSQYEYQKNINKNKFVTINKKILTLLHIQLKNMKLWWMIAHSYPYHPPRNKNFIMYWNWDKNFLLSQNPKFSKNHK